MGEVAVTPETEMALRTPEPERMLKRSPQGTRAPKLVKILRQRRMVPPEAAQRMVRRLPTEGVTQKPAEETCRRPAGCRLRPCSPLGRSCY